jgi:hypothetical protein
VWKGQYPLNGGAYYPDETPQFSYQFPKDKQQVLVKCPVNVLVTNQAGQRIGALNNDQIVNEIPDAGYFIYPESDGTYLWYFMLPVQDTYKTEITGTGDGSFQLIARGGTGSIQDYGEQFIDTGEQAQVTLDPNNPAAPLVLPGGENVIPTELGLETTTPTPTSEGEGLNWGLIAGVIGGLIVMMTLLRFARRKV